jgi:D-amino peptidase
MIDLATTVSAFLKITDEPSDHMRALRALVLHMMENYLSVQFHELSLAEELQRALDALSAVPMELSTEVIPDDGMARIDAWYIREQRGLPHNRPTAEMLKDYLQHLSQEGHLSQAWLIGEMAAHFNFNFRITLPIYQLRKHEPIHFYYYLTHHFLLLTRYLQQPLPPDGWQLKLSELLQSVKWIVENRYVDIGGEIALCLQLAGLHNQPEHQMLIEMLLKNQRDDGIVIDPVLQNSRENHAHTTGVAVIAYGGAIKAGLSFREDQEV